MGKRLVAVLSAALIMAAIFVPSASAQQVTVDETVTVGRTGCTATVKTGKLYANVWSGEVSYSPGPSASADLSDCVTISN